MRAHPNIRRNVLNTELAILQSSDRFCVSAELGRRQRVVRQLPDEFGRIDFKRFSASECYFVDAGLAGDRTKAQSLRT